MTIDAEYKEKLRQQVYYYNNDSWEFADDYGQYGPGRAIAANIAYCLVDPERFMEFYNRSEYWKQELSAALNFYKHGKYVEYFQQSKLFPEAAIRETDKICAQLPCLNLELEPVDYTNIDFGTIDIMLTQPGMKGGSKS